MPCTTACIAPKYPFGIRKVSYISIATTILPQGIIELKTMLYDLCSSAHINTQAGAFTHLQVGGTTISKENDFYNLYFRG